jgi:hypothetical protein
MLPCAGSRVRAAGRGRRYAGGLRHRGEPQLVDDGNNERDHQTLDGRCRARGLRASCSRAKPGGDLSDALLG